MFPTLLPLWEEPEGDVAGEPRLRGLEAAACFLFACLKEVEGWQEGAEGGLEALEKEEEKAYPQGCLHPKATLLASNGRLRCSHSNPPAWQSEMNFPRGRQRDMDQCKET